MSFVVRFVLRRLRKRRIEDLILVGSLSELGYRPKKVRAPKRPTPLFDGFSEGRIKIELTKVCTDHLEL